MTRREERLPEVKDPTNPRGKHPKGQKINKKKKGPAIGMLTTKTNTGSPSILNDEEEELQLCETLECSIVEKRAPCVPYMENAGPSGLELSSGLELQKKALE